MREPRGPQASPCKGAPGASLGGLPIREAAPADAPRVRALLVEAFAHDLLPFTVYRAPQSVSRLAQLAEEGRIRIMGDAEGVAISSGDHLDYLAVAASARGRGLGRLLMDDFHDRAAGNLILGRGQGAGESRRTLGYHSGTYATTLDVLADNLARRLYKRLGYEPQSESLNVRLALKNTGKPPDHWGAALAEEREKGFAAVGHAGMRLGLLVGTALRLLDAGGRTVEEALAILSTLGFAGRTEIVLLGVESAPKGYAAIQCEKSVRMVRNG